MLFDSLLYWGFFTAVLLLIAALRPAGARIALVLASYLFYAAWDVRFTLLLGGCTLANFLLGRWIDAREGPARRRALVVSIVFNLLVLGTFKYFNFFVDSFAALTGLDASGTLLRIALPVGISFFTFEGVAYATDIYRRDLPAVRSPIDFALFISFFPHLIAGPIIRPLDFFPQVGRQLALDEVDARWGVREAVKGLFKKMVLSNFFSPIADAYFNGTAYSGHAVPAWAGVLAFAMQIYFDFSGYTDIARGCARLLGYRFPSNFERPYLSANIAEFWHRWHISLSSWLRDYLYIPLGGSRRGEARTYLNLIIVMGLGGLWHGASWNFGAWGLYHGGLLAGRRLWRKSIDGTRLAAVVDHPGLRPVWVAGTFLVVCLGWIPFRAADFSGTWTTLRELTRTPGTTFLAANPALVAVPVATLVFCLIDRKRRLQNWFAEKASRPAAIGLLAMGLLSLELLARVDVQAPFIYFQF